MARAKTVTTLKAASAVTGLSVDALRTLRDAGCDGFHASGRMNTDKIVSWVKLHPDALPDDIPDYEVERALKTKVDRQRSELQLEVARGRLIDVQDAKRIYVEAAIKLKSRLLPIGKRLGQRLSMVTDPHAIESAINDEIHDALRSMSEHVKG